MPVRYTVPEPDIESFNGWGDDPIFNLESQASSLTSLVANLEEPLVIGFDADWGMGKTVFLKRWQHLSEKEQAEKEAENGDEDQEKLKVIYFDAFAHDFMEDPFIAFAHAVSTILDEDGDGKYKKGRATYKKRMAGLIKPMVKATSNYMTGGITNEIIDKLFENQESREDEIEEFREGLKDIAQEFDKIVIIVDELDRCKPDFALNMIEYIKHLFSVPNVHFILGYNGTALEDIIKTRYGVNINASRYLDKFITVKMKHMPIKNTDVHSTVGYFRAKYNEMRLGGQKNRIQIYARKSGIGGLLIEHHKPSLRDVNQFLTDLALTPIYDKEHYDYKPYAQKHAGDFMVILKLMRVLSRGLYDQIRHYENYCNNEAKANKLRDDIRDWLGGYRMGSNADRVNEEIKMAVYYFLDHDEYKNEYPTYAKSIAQGTHPLSRSVHTATGVYGQLEEDIFADIERVATVPSES